ncbi:MAG: type II toxin-antitoxin system Phd/YefM family antitoxin [Methylococcales bacterium]|nr:type II toxin-antitoxin system Phd/YefM family antitoxin [Methylococcales bacterium]
MQVVQVGQLKKDFSAILKSVQDNHEIFIIEYGKKHHKVAMLVPYVEKKEKRKFGLYKHKGSFQLTDSFTMTEEELLIG